MRIPRKLALLTAATSLIALLAVTGCATGSADGKGAGNTDVATGGKSFSTADAKTAELGTDAEPSEFPRTLTDAKGEVTIEEKPERIVVLDTGELDDVLSLGITPVGMVTTDGASPVPAYLADRVKEVESVGSISELDLEKIAELKPDLILGSVLRADNLYDQLSEIAPTVFSIRPGFPWKENFLLIGDALGMEEEAVAQLNNYQQKVEILKNETDGDTTISIVRFLPEKIRLYGTKSLIGVILADAGLARPEEQRGEDLAVEISAENIELAAGDVIFYSSYGTPEATQEASVVAGALWKNIPAVAAGDAHRVDDDIWFLGLGPIGANLILDELTEVLVN